MSYMGLREEKRLKSFKNKESLAKCIHTEYNSNAG
jgi:hypothetical protein